MTNYETSATAAHSGSPNDNQEHILLIVVCGLAVDVPQILPLNHPIATTSYYTLHIIALFSCILISFSMDTHTPHSTFCGTYSVLYYLGNHVAQPTMAVVLQPRQV